MSLGIQAEINLRPQEVGDAPTFDQDHANCSYDAGYAHRLWQILVSSSRVMERFRGKFLGKCSPVHFFWGVSIWLVRGFRGGWHHRAKV